MYNSIESREGWCSRWNLCIVSCVIHEELHCDSCRSDTTMTKAGHICPFQMLVWCILAGVFMLLKHLCILKFRWKPDKVHSRVGTWRLFVLFATCHDFLKNVVHTLLQIWIFKMQRARGILIRQRNCIPWEYLLQWSITLFSFSIFWLWKPNPNPKRKPIWWRFGNLSSRVSTAAGVWWHMCCWASALFVTCGTTPTPFFPSRCHVALLWPGVRSVFPPRPAAATAASAATCDGLVRARTRRRAMPCQLACTATWDTDTDAAAGEPWHRPALLGASTWMLGSESEQGLRAKSMRNTSRWEDTSTPCHAISRVQALWVAASCPSPSTWPVSVRGRTRPFSWRGRPVHQKPTRRNTAQLGRPLSVYDHLMIRLPKFKF